MEDTFNSDDTVEDVVFPVTVTETCNCINNDWNNSIGGIKDDN
jgi:hypothetical protein